MEVIEIGGFTEDSGERPGTSLNPSGSEGENDAATGVGCAVVSRDSAVS